MTQDWAITIWRDCSWKLWSVTDASYAENDPDWSTTITHKLIETELQNLTSIEPTTKQES